MIKMLTGVRGFLLVLALFLGGGSAVKAEPTDIEKTQLKAVVLQHIHDRTDNGIYYFLDNETTRMSELTFTAMHPVVFERKDGVFALCADFNDNQGNKFLVDYYVKMVEGSFVVISSVEGKRSILMEMAERFGL